MKTVRLMVITLLLLTLMPVAALAECEHDFYMANVTKPNCENDGYYILKCNLCGYTKKEITEGAWGHDWELVDEQEPTCDEKGHKRYTCSTCHASKTESLSAKGHDWKDSHVLEDATCTRDGSMRTVCRVCGLSGTRKIEKGHQYGSWKVTEEATDHTKGTRSRTCKVCKKKQTESFYPDGTLYKDMKGHSEEIKHLQQLLTDLGFLNDKIDGKFGKKTEAAVKKAQKAYGLTADGIAWPQTLYELEIAWDVEFGAPEEPDGRGEVLCCEMCILEDGTVSWQLCDEHLSYEMQATAGLYDGASEAERLNACVVAWQAELDVLYQAWLQACTPEEQPMIINHKTMFLGYLNSQQMLWNAQFGAGSLQVLEMVNQMLMEQCCTLCEVTYSLTLEE